jgi:formate hydrogenlyase transcriptional activator
MQGTKQANAKTQVFMHPSKKKLDLSLGQIPHASEGFFRAVQMRDCGWQFCRRPGNGLLYENGFRYRRRNGSMAVHQPQLTASKQSCGARKHRDPAGLLSGIAQRGASGSTHATDRTSSMNDAAVSAGARMVECLAQLAATGDCGDVLRIVLAFLENAFPVALLDLILHDQGKGTMRRFSPGGLAHFQEEEELLERLSPAGYVYRSQRVICEEAELPPAAAKSLSALAGKKSIHAFALIPLTTSRTRLGILAIGSTQRQFPQGQLEWLVQFFCEHVASAVERIVSLQNGRELLLERDHLKVMVEVTRSLVKPCELPELFVNISTILRPFMQPDYVGLALGDRSSSQLRLSVMDFPEGKGVIREDRLIPGGGAFHSGHPVLITSLAESPMPFDLSRLLLAEGLNSACFIPLAGTGGPVGTLGFGSVRANAFSQHQEDLLGELAPSIGVALENALAVQRIARLRSNGPLRSDRMLKADSQPRTIVGADSGLREVLKTIEMVASTDATVLLSGETGTGKELVARAVHDLSDRRERSFVTMNCAAIPAGLLESELFGHEKGAFTGASAARLGRFELAHQGTLFLDEAGDIPLELQPKLLRVLQESEFERLGSARTMRVDVRIVAATNRDLAQMVRDGQFRSDLFYRLNVIPVRVPPLRERCGDIAALAAHFIKKYAERFRRQVDSVAPSTLDRLQRWYWPGNVRELENLIERAVALSTGPVLELPPSELNGFDTEAESNRIKSAENEIIRRAMRESNGIIGGPNGAAARLGMKRSTLQSRLKKMT